MLQAALKRSYHSTPDRPEPDSLADALHAVLGNRFERENRHFDQWLRHFPITSGSGSRLWDLQLALCDRPYITSSVSCSTGYYIHYTFHTRYTCSTT